ncbi:BadF/BadG/BcrA/BcrD ATPase family protein [Loktanella sp. R86503]|uniref:BadF/BadG/BcrA/BcrD ATPase family protein n=1 Tax=Loktanella sp. R86503 TaxID=3093847 RepID=UPI0036DDC332
MHKQAGELQAIADMVAALVRPALLAQTARQSWSEAAGVKQNLCLGVDGGGSGCRAALCDAQGQIVGVGFGGPANATSDFDGACGSVADAIAQAMDAAGTDMEHVAAGFLGLAGMRKPGQAQDMIATLNLLRCTVTEDRPTMIAGALGDSDGAVVALGTGSFVGVASGGIVRAVGGWGLQLSDQASAAWIGRAGLSATLEAVDNMLPMGPMAHALLARWQGDTDAIVDFAAKARPADYGSIAPLVTRTAKNDPAAADILRQAILWIERALAALAYDSQLPLVLTGGLGAALEPWMARDGRQFAKPAGSALDGALLLARRAAWG